MRVLGLDIGTQGARAIVCDGNGNVYAEASTAFAEMNTSANPAFKEQHPQDWDRAAKAAIASCVRQMGGEHIDALSLDCTSGTVLAIDENMNPVTEGIMYNDSRAKEQAAQAREAAHEQEESHGYRFNASYSLPKILWVMQNQPDIYEITYKFLHQSDYMYGILTGTFGISDYSNALKTGYDLINERWPDFISKLGFDKKKLPYVVPTNKKIGTVCAATAEETGLSRETIVYAGATDGYASALAAGVSVPGHWATVMGTTMVLKGITKNLVLDPLGRIYSHKHPQGWWLPGGASNTGGRMLTEEFGSESYAKLNEGVADQVPTEEIVYPLSVRGERFPFVRPDAEGFGASGIADEKKRYAAIMEGVGYTEKLSYELLGQMGCEVGEVIHTCGGACRSQEWLQIRSDIMNKVLRIPRFVDAAMGSAMIAAAGFSESDLSDTVRKMVKITLEVRPNEANVSKYVKLYHKFKKELVKRGYLN